MNAKSPKKFVGPKIAVNVYYFSAAAAVGINPVNAEKPKQSKWVKDALSPEQQRIVEERQRARQDIFNISNKEITKPENIDAIREMVQKSGKFPFLVRHLNEFDFMSLIGEAFFNRATSRMLASCQRYGQMNFIDLYISKIKFAFLE